MVSGGAGTWRSPGVERPGAPSAALLSAALSRGRPAASPPALGRHTAAAAGHRVGLATPAAFITIPSRYRYRYC
ncbi:MAG TPA: hypothetical protein VFN74_08730 [Chloroflexota bacterium]|nr:hypothetical protein [Chloroflexota bacterium]